MSRRRKPRFQWPLVAAAMMGIALMAANPLRQLYAQNRQISLARARLSAVSDENTRLQDRLVKMKDPAHVEILARQELGLVRPGEVSFSMSGPPPVPQAAPPPKPRSWWARLLIWIRFHLGLPERSYSPS